MTVKKRGENQYFVSEHVCMLSPKDVTSRCLDYKLVGHAELPSTQGHHPADTATAEKAAGLLESFVARGRS